MRLLCATIVAGAEICPWNPVVGPEKIPHQVFYTGAYDPNLKQLRPPNFATMYTTRGLWPDDYRFHYFDDEDVNASMRKLDAHLESTVNVTGAYEAFLELRPFAFKADLWRYCILWACGGIYLDAKMALTVNFTTFVQMAYRMHSPEAGKALYTCDSTHGKKWGQVFVWQGFLISEPRQPDLLAVIRLVIKYVKTHAFAEDNDKSHMFAITGPMAFGVAVGRRPGWKHRIHLPCDKKYKINVLTTSRFRQASHDELRHLAVNDSAVHDLDLEEVVIFDGDNETVHLGLRGSAANSYSIMWNSHRVYHHYHPKSKGHASRHSQSGDERHNPPQTLEPRHLLTK